MYLYSFITLFVLDTKIDNQLHFFFVVIIVAFILPSTSYPISILILQPMFLGMCCSSSCVDSIEIIFCFSSLTWLLYFNPFHGFTLLTVVTFLDSKREEVSGSFATSLYMNQLIILVVVSSIVLPSILLMMFSSFPKRLDFNS